MTCTFAPCCKWECLCYVLTQRIAFCKVVKHSSWGFLDVTMCTASLTFNSSKFYPHSVFMCFVWIWEQTAIISLYNVNWLVCITQTECVYCEVRTGCLNITQVKLRLHADSVCICCMNFFSLFNCKSLTQIHNSALFKKVLSTFSCRSYGSALTAILCTRQKTTQL